SYLFVDFDELEGRDLDRLTFRGLAHNDCCRAGNPPPSPGDPSFEIDTADLFFEQFTLRSHVLSFHATYGITDRWDVNFLLPVVFTELELRARALLNNESGTGTHFFDLPAGRTAEVRSVDDDKVGIGDLLLRTKYYLYDAQGFNLALGSSLRVPTGDEDDFQGIGDTTLTPFLALSQEYGPLDFHANGGIDVNFDDSDRSRVRYAAGITVQVIKQLALVMGVIGSSNLTTDRISVKVRQFVNAPGTSEAPPTTLPVFRTVSDNLSTDIVDFVIGFKVNPYGSVIIFFNALMPLNNDGLRADVIPAAGVEVSF
ncbi:MAG: transporter, partial [Candidatus Binatia bacterium]